jgi:hypothetical protein
MNYEQTENKITKAAYLKAWRTQNADKVKKAMRDWYLAHKDDETFKQHRREYNKMRYQNKKQKAKEPNEPVQSI